MGYTIAEHLALHGANVWMGARSEEKAREAIKTFETVHAGIKGKGKMQWLPLDLTSPIDVQKSADEFLKSATRLDILGESPRAPRGRKELTRA